MTIRNQPLSERQLKVLEWVSEGSPDGVWEGTSYKRSAYALVDRDLITVDRRRRSWSAALTEDGRYYLQHGRYRTRPESRRSISSTKSQRQRRSADATISPSDLIAEVQEAGGKLVIPDPTPERRAAYRSAISVAISSGLVPAGHALRHTGRDRGDLVIRLAPRSEDTRRKEQLAPVPVPTSLDPVHEAVRVIRDERPQLLDVEGAARERALLLLQALADECERRSCEFVLRPEDTPTFRISARGVDFDFRMYEELERRPVLNEDELSEVRYTWQRVRSTVRDVRSGKLALSTGSSYSPVWWADRKRWSLADRLPHVFEYIEKTAQERIDARERARRDLEERKHAWAEAKARARELYVGDLNRRRRDEQLARTRRAEELRSYATEIEQIASGTREPDQAQEMYAWAAWAREDARATDPLLNPAELKVEEPEEISASDLEAFMPRGMSVLRPPQ